MSQENSNEKKDLSDLDKTILTGRIYPVIQGCIGNRYRIIVGYFAAVGFLLSLSKEKLTELLNAGAICMLAWVFTLFVLHNFINYWRNSSDRAEREGGKKYLVPPMETSSSIIMVTLVWCSYFLLRKYITA